MKKNITILTLFILAFCASLSAQEIYILHHENGNIKVKGTLKDGKKTGLWEAYDAAKKLIIKREYDNNILAKNYLSDIENKEDELKLEDVLWSKRIVRNLTSNSAKNSPLYTKEYLRLVLIKAIKNNKIKGYTTLEFDTVLSQSKAMSIVANMDISKSSFTLKEDWFFNKKTNSMDVLLVALAITTDDNTADISFYYPEIKELFHNEELMLGDQKSTLGNYFKYRLFESEITKESSINEKEMTSKRAKEIEKLLLDTEIYFWFKNN